MVLRAAPRYRQEPAEEQEEAGHAVGHPPNAAVCAPLRADCRARKPARCESVPGDTSGENLQAGPHTPTLL